MMATTLPLRIGLYPGSFDPITKGHFDIIQRSCRLVDRLVVAIARNEKKGPLFSVEERVAMVKHDLEPLRQKGFDLVVLPFENLLIDFVVQVNASIIIRGLRAVSDFEYEFQMAGMNARLNDEIETVFLMASERHQFISSRFVKEVSFLSGDVSEFISANTLSKLQEKHHA